MATFVSVHNYLFIDIIALLPSFPLITDQALDDIKSQEKYADRNAPGRSFIVILTVLHKAQLEIWSSTVCLLRCVFLKAPPDLGGFSSSGVTCSASMVSIWAWPYSHGRPELLSPVPAIWFFSPATLWANTFLVSGCIPSFGCVVWCVCTFLSISVTIGSGN